MAGIVERPKSVTATAKDIARRVFRQENVILLVALIALVIGLSFATKGLTTRLVNIKNILAVSSMRGMAAIGEAFVILTAGIDLSVGGIGLFTGIFGASLITRGDMNIIGHPKGQRFKYAGEEASPISQGAWPSSVWEVLLESPCLPLFG